MHNYRNATFIYQKVLTSTPTKGGDRVALKTKRPLVGFKSILNKVRGSQQAEVLFKSDCLPGHLSQSIYFGATRIFQFREKGGTVTEVSLTHNSLILMT